MSIDLIYIMVQIALTWSYNPAEQDDSDLHIQIYKGIQHLVYTRCIHQKLSTYFSEKESKLKNSCIYVLCVYCFNIDFFIINNIGKNL